MWLSLLKITGIKLAAYEIVANMEGIDFLEKKRILARLYAESAAKLRDGAPWTLGKPLSVVAVERGTQEP